MAIASVTETTAIPTEPDLARAAGTELTLPAPLAFGRSASTDLEVLRLLREATSHAVRLRWTLAGLPSLPLHTHIHLVPPGDGIGAEAAAYAREWAAGYRYGGYFYRQGPGFVMVKDVRPGGDPVRMTISDGAEQFLAMAAARQESDLDAEAAGMLGIAEQAGLLVRQAGRLLVLPYRMRHWPVPYVAI